MSSGLRFILRRRQLPIRLAFSMSIHKAQGQSLDRVGIYLNNPVFAHGQLYVALSRCTDSRNLRILLPPNSNRRTPNIVYREVIDWVHRKILYIKSVVHIHQDILSEAPAISIYIWFVEVSEAGRHVLHMTRSSFHWQVFTWLWHHIDFLYMGESNTDLQHLLSRCAIHLNFWDESCNT